MRDSLIKILPQHHLKKTVFDTCLILQYYRVELLCHDAQQLAVEPVIFEMQMEYLANNFNVISSEEMEWHLRTSVQFAPRTVVVTFDGGYTDVLYNAKNVLERFGIFATVFSSSESIITKRQFWWDRLEDLLIANKADGELEIEIDGQLFRWILKTQLNRFCAYDDLYAILCKKTPIEQKEIIYKIANDLEINAEELDSHRLMDAQELKELDECDLVTIGGHPHSFVRLSLLDRGQQIKEIKKNKEVLEEVLGQRVKCFSYPFDNIHSVETAQILSDNGFGLAYGNYYGAVSLAKEIDFYNLPRVKVGN